MNQVINGNTQLMGLLGERISYTLSPLLHNHAARSLGLNLVYLPLPLPSGQVGNFLQVAWDMGVIGFNVTTPHKSLVASLLPGHSLSSVNTIYRGTDRWRVASTDGPGFVQGLGHMGAVIEEFQDLVFLGDGGAVVAILDHLANLHALGLLARLPRVSIFSRSRQAKEHLRLIWPDSSLIRFGNLSSATLGATLAVSPEALIIQATSAPHRGDDLAYLLPALVNFRGAFCDLVYGASSRLLQFCKQAGLRAQDGKAMLIEQARQSQKLWWGQAASYEELRAAIEATLAIQI